MALAKQSYGTEFKLRGLANTVMVVELNIYAGDVLSAPYELPYCFAERRSCGTAPHLPSQRPSVILTRCNSAKRTVRDVHYVLPRITPMRSIIEKFYVKGNKRVLFVLVFLAFIGSAYFRTLWLATAKQ
jgi:hypothetical protein